MPGPGRIRHVVKFDIHCGVLKAKIGRSRAVLCGNAHFTRGLALLLVAGCGIGIGNAQHFRLNEEIISDPATGAAILGYDPIAYFVDGRPRMGAPRLQANALGKVWYFSSQANLAEFQSRAHVYVPGFGGHDPVAVARGVAVAGSPDLHVIMDGKLYLFRSAENRAQFLDVPQILAEAERNWPEVRLNLTP